MTKEKDSTKITTEPNMTEAQISEELLKLTTDNDNVQPVVEDSPENVDSPENLDSPENDEEIEPNNNFIVWHGYLLKSKEDLDFANQQYISNINDGYTKKQSIKLTLELIKNRNSPVKTQKNMDKIKRINYNIMYFESLGLQVNSETGLPTQNAGNYKALLLNKHIVPHTFKWNEFSECIEMDDRLLKDNDITLLSNLFSNVAGFESDKKLNGAIIEVALDNSYHPVKQYLESIVWDGVPRVETMFTTFLSAKDCELYHVYAKLFMIAAIKRVYKPGCKFDNMLVLQGEQGNGKSTFCEKLAVNDKWYNDNIIIADRDKDSLLYMQDAWIVIMDELDAWNKADTNAAKGFMSKRSDKFRAPYAQHSEEHPRHCVFIGNTNDETFLKDSTAITERRYWVIKTEGNWETSRDKIKSMTPEMIDQLWAEAMVMYNENKDIELVIPPELYKTMIDEQLQFKNENGCEQYDFLEDILNREYSPTVFDNVNNLYNEYENRVIIEDKSILKKMNYFPISSLKFLFEKEKWFYRKNTFKMFSRWSQSSIWTGSKWESKNISRNNHKFVALVRIENTNDNSNDDNDDNDDNRDNKNKFIRFTGDNDDPYKFINDDTKTKITGYEEFV